MSDETIRVAVVGTTDVGRGWAALAVGAGWPVALYDSDGRTLDSAPEEIARRARFLVTLHSADPQQVESGIRQLTVGRSLLQACQDADWIIEAGPDDARAKPRAVESIDAVAATARVVTCSTAGLTPKQVAARTKRPDRVLVAHPLTPPELIPLVEIVPGAGTDQDLVAVVKQWLRALGRFPIVVKKPVPGSVVGRIVAAVWREAIDLVLNDVVALDELDRAISLGPALAWAAGGPHLNHHLAGGDQAVAPALQLLLKSYESVWNDLATWTQLDADQEHKLIHQIERTYAGDASKIRHARDRRLATLLTAFEDLRRRRAPS